MLFESPTNGGARSVATLEDYLEAIRNRKLWVIGGVVLGLGASMFLTKDRIETYEAESAVLLNPSPAGRADGGLTAPNLEREAKVAVSEEVTNLVLADLATSSLPGSISASFTPQSDVISITASAPSPAEAAEIANSFANTYVELRLQDQNAVWDSLTAGVQANIDTFNATIAGVNLRVAELDQELAVLRDQTPGTDRDARITDVTTQRTSAIGQIATTQGSLNAEQTKLSDLQKSRSSSLVAAKLLSEAEPPPAPIGLSRKVFLGAGLLGGLLLGIIAAFLRERLDRKASGQRDVELALGGTVIGTVPRFSFLYRRGQWSLVMANGKSGVSLQRAREAYRRLRASVLYLAKAEQARVIVVTSTKPREGKSTTSANMALALALGGTRTALVSADLRKPSLEGMFLINNERGLSTYLTGKSDTVHTESVQGIEALTIIPSGPEVPNPSELLGSPRFNRLVDLLKTEFDIVIIDSPPLGAAADSLAAAESADGVIVVVDGSRTETTELLAIRRELDRAGAKLLGAVLNREAVKFKLPFLNRGYGYYGTADGGATTAISRNEAVPSLTHPNGRQSPGRRAADAAVLPRDTIPGEPAPLIPEPDEHFDDSDLDVGFAEIDVIEEVPVDEIEEIEEIEDIEDEPVDDIDDIDDIDDTPIAVIDVIDEAPVDEIDEIDTDDEAPVDEIDEITVIDEVPVAAAERTPVRARGRVVAPNRQTPAARRRRG